MDGILIIINKETLCFLWYKIDLLLFIYNIFYENVLY
jgi:hypothetical protein